MINDYRAGIFKIGMAETNTQRVAGAIKGLFDNSNDLALHLVTMIPIAFVLAFENKNPLRKIVFWGITLLMIAAVIITFSRGGFLGLIAMALVLVRQIGRRNKTRRLQRWCWALCSFWRLRRALMPDGSRVFSTPRRPHRLVESANGGVEALDNGGA